MTVPVFTTGPSSSAFKAQQEFTAPLSQVLTAEAQAAWLYSPTSSIDRMVELNEAEADTQETEYGPQLVPDTGVGIPLAQEAAQGRARAAGVKLDIPARGITQGALDILVRRKQEENDRKEILQRADNDLLTGALRLGTGLGVSLLDPINVASAFIPVVGITRYSNMLASQSSRLGRAGVRLKVGGVEGAFGAALVEPIILTAADAEQADYNLTDSMLNIAFGTIMGGGLHAGAGAFGDAIKARQNRVSPVGSSAEALMNASPEVRQAMARGAMSQMATGRMVDVEVVGNFTPVRSTERKVFQPGRKGDFNVDEVDASDVNSLVQDFTRGGLSGGDERAFASIVNKFGDDAPDGTTVYRGFTEGQPIVKDGQLSISTGDLDTAKSFAIARNEDVMELQGVDGDFSRPIPIARIKVPKGSKTLDPNKFGGAQPKEQEIILSGRLEKTPTPPERILENDIEYEISEYVVRPLEAEGAPTQRVKTVFERDRTPGIGRQIEDTFAAERYYLADKNASDEISARVAAAKVSDDPTATAQEELSDAMSQLADELKRLDLEDVDFKAEDAAVAQADDMAIALDAATSCMLRRA